MKKRFIILMCLVVFFTGCSYNSTPQPIPSEPILESQSESSIESSEDDSIILTDKEQLIFDCLIIASSTFKNPSEMRLLDIGDEMIIEERNDYPNGSHYIYVKLQGTNSMAGTMNNIYTLQLEDAIFKSTYMDVSLPKGDLRLSGSSINRKATEIDIKKINLSLKKYWEDLGL